jgi:hypothetical protein
MFGKRDKRWLYWLIEEYLSGAVSEKIFCDEFYYCYSLEPDHLSLTPLEAEVFEELNKGVSRFLNFRRIILLYETLFLLHLNRFGHT